jgi:hypothetical protein
LASRPVACRWPLPMGQIQTSRQAGGIAKDLMRCNIGTLRRAFGVRCLAYHLLHSAGSQPWLTRLDRETRPRRAALPRACGSQRDRPSLRLRLWKRTRVIGSMRRGRVITTGKFIVHGQSCAEVFTARPPTKAEPLATSRALTAVARIAVTAITLIMPLKFHQLVIESDD